MTVRSKKQEINMGSNFDNIVDCKLIQTNKEQGRSKIGYSSLIFANLNIGSNYKLFKTKHTDSSRPFKIQ